ncbi:hypothetical protein QUF55_07860 [Clostridiaceae bacterium HSG29]|nr:hypothetical protein [Clostridiaceae bacterium HSG29]
MSNVNLNDPRVSAIKSQYTQAQKNGDTSEMAKLKVKGKQIVKQIKQNESSKSDSKIENEHGDTLEISTENKKI